MSQNKQIRDSGLGREALSVSRYQSACLIEDAAILLALAADLPDSRELAALLRSCLIMIACAADGLALEIAFTLHPDFYQRKKQFRKKGFKEKWTELGFTLPNELDLLWQARLSLSHPEPDHLRNKQANALLNVESLRGLIQSFINLATEAWTEKMPLWFKKQLDLAAAIVFTRVNQHPSNVLPHCFPYTMDKRIQRVFQGAPPVPHDIFELTHILKLLRKIPTYIEGLSELSKRVEEFARSAAHHTRLSYSYEIEKMIFRAFFIELENREFTEVTDEDIIRLKADVVHEGVISRRNVSCEICGENRSIDRSHIIPTKLGGPATSDNLLFLCPTHHRLFDRCMLSRAEYARIDWERKSAPSQQYAKTVILLAQQELWKRVDERNFASLGDYEIDTKPFVKYAVMQVIDLFRGGQLLKRRNVYAVMAPELRNLSKHIISLLVREGVLSLHKEGSSQFLSLRQPDFEPSDNILLRILDRLE